MRAGPSPPEALLWAALVHRKLGGVAFRRQVLLAGYIYDFVAASHRLIVEVDGRQHERRVAADARRDRKLVRLGYRVLRLEAQLVLRELPRATVQINLGRGVTGVRALATPQTASADSKSTWDGESPERSRRKSTWDGDPGSLSHFTRLQAFKMRIVKQ